MFGRRRARRQSAHERRSTRLCADDADRAAAVEQMNELLLTQLAEKLKMTDSQRAMGSWIKGLASASEIYLDEAEITAGASTRVHTRT